MEWIGATILLLAALAVAFQVSVLRKARKMEGKPLPDLKFDCAPETLSDAPMLLYFYSPNCAPCRRMSPILDELARTHSGVLSVDISQDLETARKFNIHATPTTILVKNGTIVKVLLGFQSKDQLTSLF